MMPSRQSIGPLHAAPSAAVCDEKQILQAKTAVAGNVQCRG